MTFTLIATIILLAIAFTLMLIANTLGLPAAFCACCAVAAGGCYTINKL